MWIVCEQWTGTIDAMACNTFVGEEYNRMGYELYENVFYYNGIIHTNE